MKVVRIQKILTDYTTLTNSWKSIVLCWIPSHVNIPGNERADAAAKSALSLPITGMKLPGCDLMPRVCDYCLRKWQEIWSNCANNKLYAIYQTVGTVGSVVHNKGLSCHESIIINRLRIGHTRLTHSYLLSGDDQPTCSTCGHPLTVRHILWDCVDLQDVRQRHYSVKQRPHSRESPRALSRTFSWESPRVGHVALKPSVSYSRWSPPAFS